MGDINMNIESYEIAINTTKTCVLLKLNGETKNNINFNIKGYCGYCDEKYFIFMDGYMFIKDKFIEFNSIINMLNQIGDINNFLKIFDLSISGDFCLIILNKATNELFIARDPMGHTICYLYSNEEYIHISNNASILYTLKNHHEINLRYVYKYLSHQTPGFMEDIDLPIHGFVRCLPGHYIYKVLRNKLDKNLRQHQYYDVSNINVKYDVSEEEAISLFMEELDASFKKSPFLALDDVYVTLSGGLDSTVICNQIYNMGIPNKFHYLTFRGDGDERDEKYIVHVENYYNLSSERIFMKKEIPTLFEDFYTKKKLSKKDEEPGSLMSIKNADTVYRYILDAGCSNIVLGNVESLYRNVFDSVVKVKEYNELSFFEKVRLSKHYSKIDIKETIKSSEAKSIGSWVWDTVDSEYNPNALYSNLLYEFINQFYYKNSYEELLKKSIQQIKYENILSPNSESLINFRYAQKGIRSFTPLHSSNFLNFAISMPSFIYKNDIKYFLKKVVGLSNEIISRPKISSAHSEIIKKAIPIASFYLKNRLEIEKLINLQLFLEICRRIISGNMQTQDLRYFFSIISLENFIINNDIKIKI